MQKIERRGLLSVLWIFLTVNYIFCDVFTLMYSPELKQIMNGSIGGIEITQGFLLSFALIMELAMVMIVLSKYLPYPVNRLSNIVVALLLAVVQGGSLFFGESTMHYKFFSIVEIATHISIIYFAATWQREVST